MAESLSPTLDDLTAEIKFHLDAGNSKLIEAAAHYIEVGKRLIAAKSLIPHGGWKEWLDGNFNLSQDSASNFMNIAKRFGANSEPARNLNYSQMLALLKLPADDTPKFLESMATAGSPVQSMSKRALRDAVKAWKQSIEGKNLETVTIDVTATSVTPAVAAVDAQIQAFQPYQMLLPPFDKLPALPAQIKELSPPPELVDAADKIGAALIIRRAGCRAEISPPSIVVCIGAISSNWIVALAMKATALINCKVNFRLGSDGVAKKPCVILYYGNNTDAFSNTFRQFGLILFTNSKAPPVTAEPVQI